MANPKAQAAKDKGNAAFKIGDYPSAIGHYTDAILADRSDPTFPLNRAAAYLKLGKNEDAERDSTTVLQLNPSNVKALFRRAQARQELGKLLDARQDLNDAIKLEPSNSSIKEELKKVDLLVAIEKSKKSKLESTRATLSTPTSPSTGKPPPKRRRVPIEIVEPPGYQRPSTSSPPLKPPVDAKRKVQTTPVPTPAAPPAAQPNPDADTLTPVSTRSLKSTPPLPQLPSTSAPSTTTTPTAGPAAYLPPKPAQSSFSAAKTARESSKPSRVGVGGGIFRANGQNTIFSPKVPPASPATSSSATAAETTKGTSRFPLPVATANGNAPPMTMFNFSKAWEANPSLEDRWKMIISIPPASIPSMCKSSLEPSLFISIIDVFTSVMSNGEHRAETREVIEAYLRGFEGVQRFSTVLMFLNDKEKSRVTELWKMLGIDVGSLNSVWSTLAR